MHAQTKTQIILASASMGRRKLLERLGVNFDIVPSNIDELSISDLNPIKKIQKRARTKAQDVVKKLIQDYPSETSYLVIAADSEAVLGNTSYGKAKDKSDAKRIVKALMGQTHTFTTATSIHLLQNAKTIQQWNNISQTRVTTRVMTEQEIAAGDLINFSARSQR